MCSETCSRRSFFNVGRGLCRDAEHGERSRSCFSDTSVGEGSRLHLSADSPNLRSMTSIRRVTPVEQRAVALFLAWALDLV